MMQKIKQAFGVQDMTVGRPMDSLVRFSIPLLLGNLAQQLYNTWTASSWASMWGTPPWRRWEPPAPS